MKAKTELTLVCFIFLLAFFTRIFALSSSPPALHNDEASFLYNAQALLQTGKDEDGRSWPLYLNSYIDPKPALISYLQIPFVAILGTTTTAARLPLAICGFMSLILVYILLKQLETKKSLRLICLFMLSLSPWHTTISRGTQEVIISFTLGLASLIFLNILWKKNKSHVSIKKLLPTLFAFFVSFFLASYTYHSAKIVLPLLVILLLIKHQAWQRKKIASLIIIITIFSTLGLTFLSPGGLKRAQAVSIFSDEAILAVVTEQLNTATPFTPPLILRTFFNKLVRAGITLYQNYTSHFTAQFFLFSVDEPTRYNIPFQGLLYFFELPLLIIGILLSYKKHHKTALFWLSWLFIAPLPATLTNQEIPSNIRAFWLIVPIYYFVAFAVWQIWQQIKKTSLKTPAIGMSILIYLWHIAFFWHQSLFFWPVYQPWDRNYADQNMAAKIDQVGEGYKKIVISRFSGQPYIYLALENLISLPDLQNSYPQRLQTDYQFGKFQFKGDKCYLGTEENTLYAVEVTCDVPAEYKKIGRASHKDGNGGYLFVEYQKKNN